MFCVCDATCFAIARLKVEFALYYDEYAFVVSKTNTI